MTSCAGIVNVTTSSCFSSAKSSTSSFFFVSGSIRDSFLMIYLASGFTWMATVSPAFTFLVKAFSFVVASVFCCSLLSSFFASFSASKIATEPFSVLSSVRLYVVSVLAAAISGAPLMAEPQNKKPVSTPDTTCLKRIIANSFPALQKICLIGSIRDRLDRCLPRKQRDIIPSLIV